ncbi:hypothetical protein ABFA07_002737 [Porites harrisoni]
MEVKFLLFAALFLVACVEFSSQDEVTDVEAPALQYAADNGDEENESQEDTDIEQYVDEDEESEEMQDDADLEDPIWSFRRRRCTCSKYRRRKCYYIKNCYKRRRVCFCVRLRYRGDEVASDNQVNDESIEDKAEELEDTGDEENESQEDTDIEQYADEDEESEEMQDDAGLEDPIWPFKRRRRCPLARVRRRCPKYLKKRCFYLKKRGFKKRLFCLCFRRCYGDETANDV